jgi:threonine dehydrogenase-like Zn-dependent dehydrogenase
MSTLDARAFWISRPGKGEIRAESLAPPGADEVAVRAVYSGISCGTERLVFNGRVPPSEHERMRAPFQVGEFPGPVKYGYASVGVVEQGPPALLGRHVFCLYPHQSRYVVPVGHAHPLPPDVPPGRAVLAANMETALNGLWDAAPRIGDAIAVVGGGALGCLVARLATGIPGTRVQLVDSDDSRAGVAAALGVDFATPDEARGDADLVVHASASAAGLATALTLAGFEATVLELSWFGEGSVGVPLGGAFHARRLRLLSSQVGAVSPSRRARRSHGQRLAGALSLLADPALDVLISAEDDFENLPAVMSRIARHGCGPGDNPLCHRLRYA